MIYKTVFSDTLWQKLIKKEQNRESGEYMRPSGIGGQAVIEGVMMKNKDRYAVAVRKPDNQIVIENSEYHSISDKYKFFRLPIIRGIVAFIDSMSLGTKTLTYSASFYEEEDEAKPSKVEKAMGKVFKEKAEAVIMGITLVIAMILAIGIFMILPWFLADLLGKQIDNEILQALIEGAIRLVIFILYVSAISMMQDIKRVYMYHGAEHKTINCVENGLPLNVENVRKQSRQHKRCGTSFMLYVMIISILLFMCIRVDQPVLRVVLRILLVPVIAGISYEFIKLAGRSNSKIMGILSKPGMWLQGLTTKEPDDSMIEVAIASVEAVFDWKAFQEGADSEFAAAKARVNRNGDAPIRPAPVKRAQGKVNRRSGFYEKREKERQEREKRIEAELQQQKGKPAKEKKANKGKSSKPQEVRRVAVAKKATSKRRPMVAIEEVRRKDNILNFEEEDDDILRALDKFVTGDEDEAKKGEE